LISNTGFAGLMPWRKCHALAVLVEVDLFKKEKFFYKCSIRFKISMRVPLEPKLSVLDVFFRGPGEKAVSVL